MKENLDDIYKIYFHEIYRFLLSLCHDHHVAENLVQETFLRAYLYIENYKGDKVKAWLFTVAHNACIDHYRKHNRTVIKEQSFFLPLSDKRKTPIDTIVIQEEVREIVSLLKDLPEKHKYAVLLHDFHGLSYNEAAQVMNVKQPHFKILLFRGRQAIRRRKGGEK
ncbi:sigma-70 family RNA polymerase sigma factor [Schinkia azotoformans]|uniref:ECF subfamily RNA polymerase sigma-24 factor n=1 Tax=Schinkia azotoformans LMG 9581 TaxID=1131731 RepID=K6D2Z1_SCHAZ|nr:sigma-70 family RNA polymerase sigma factor [Schinkia azotoformans]EKN62599.1 ECF subfamily RNA polymerase sigma-24 factor [Schinkia azotoformans LMG 9581]MEC1639307.1 sigma-70 family RNA polymerase sigma factor [Schinkia azotoformans]MEC1945894.1 sigma-70 family RNA polymerase sigma factor [Schinkia azotoformans]